VIEVTDGLYLWVYSRVMLCIQEEHVYVIAEDIAISVYSQHLYTHAANKLL
jgi:hypothetical protein